MATTKWRNGPCMIPAVVLLCALHISAAPPAKTTGCKPLHGAIYEPFALNSDDICLSNEQVAIDMQIMSTFTKSVRLYSLSSCPEATDVILTEAKKREMTVLLGVYIGTDADVNESELKELTTVMKKHSGVVSAVVVGSDAIVNGKIGSYNRFAKFMDNVALLLDFIGRVRKIMKKNLWKHPVTTAEGWGVWESEFGLELAEALDFICLKIVPFEEGRSVVCPPRAKSNCISSAVYATAKSTGISEYYSKDVWVCETGWPTDGERCCFNIPNRRDDLNAVPSTAAASTYLTEFVKKVGDRPYYIASAFDRDWRRVWSPCPACAEKNLALSSFKDGICDLCDQDYLTGIFDQHRERKSSYKIPKVQCPLPSLPKVRTAPVAVKQTFVEVETTTTTKSKKTTGKPSSPKGKETITTTSKKTTESSKLKDNFASTSTRTTKLSKSKSGSGASTKAKSKTSLS